MINKKQLSVGMNLEAWSNLLEIWVPVVITDVRNFGTDPLVQVHITQPNCTVLRHLNDLRFVKTRLSKLQEYLYVECDDPKRLAHYVEYGLPGLYSLDNDGVFREGVRPTHCRIRIHGPGRAGIVLS